MIGLIGVRDPKYKTSSCSPAGRSSQLAASGDRRQFSWDGARGIFAIGLVACGNSFAPLQSQSRSCASSLTPRPLERTERAVEPQHRPGIGQFSQFSCAGARMCRKATTPARLALVPGGGFADDSGSTMQSAVTSHLSGKLGGK